MYKLSAFTDLTTNVKRCRRTKRPSALSAAPRRFVDNEPMSLPAQTHSRHVQQQQAVLNEPMSLPAQPYSRYIFEIPANSALKIPPSRRRHPACSLSVHDVLEPVRA